MMNHHTRSMSFSKEIFTLMQEENQLDSMHKHIPEGRKENHYEVGEGGTKKMQKDWRHVQTSEVCPSKIVTSELGISHA